jgi:hypothetical protein
MSVMQPRSTLTTSRWSLPLAIAPRSDLHSSHSTLPLVPANAPIIFSWTLRDHALKRLHVGRRIHGVDDHRAVLQRNHLGPRAECAHFLLAGDPVLAGRAVVHDRVGVRRALHAGGHGRRRALRVRTVIHGRALAVAAVTAVVLVLLPFIMQQSSALAADLAGLAALALAAVAEVPAGLQPMAVATAGLLAQAAAISGVQPEAVPFAAVFVLAAAEADVPFADLWASQASAAGRGERAREQGCSEQAQRLHESTSRKVVTPRSHSLGSTPLILLSISSAGRKNRGIGDFQPCQAAAKSPNCRAGKCVR